MKSLALIGLLAIGSASAQDLPKYTTKSKIVLGQYEQSRNSSCTETVNGRERACLGATVKKKPDGKLVVIVEDYGDKSELPLFEKNGKLTFSWVNPIDDDCDDPGCWNLLSLSGVIYPSKKGSKYLPALRLYVKKDYVAPEDPVDPEGEQTEVETYTKR